MRTRRRPKRRRDRRLAARKHRGPHCHLAAGFGPIHGHELSPAGERNLNELRKRNKSPGRRSWIANAIDIAAALFKGRKKREQRQASRVEGPETKKAA